MIKGTDEQPDELAHRVRSGGLYPHGVGMCHIPSVDVFTYLKAPGNLYYWDFYGGFLTQA